MSLVPKKTDQNSKQTIIKTEEKTAKLQ